MGVPAGTVRTQSSPTPYLPFPGRTQMLSSRLGRRERASPSRKLVATPVAKPIHSCGSLTALLGPLIIAGSCPDGTCRKAEQQLQHENPSRTRKIAIDRERETLASPVAGPSSAARPPSSAARPPLRMLEQTTGVGPSNAASTGRRARARTSRATSRAASRRARRAPSTRRARRRRAAASADATSRRWRTTSTTCARARR